MTARFDDPLLDSLRHARDPQADAAVADYFERAGMDDPGRIMRALVQHADLPPEERSPLVSELLDAPFALPPWADTTRIARAQDFFAEWGVHVFTALMFAALPSAYAAARGVQVLHLTARLQTHAKRRLNETAQFHLDVMRPGGLGAGGVGITTTRRVRLMHAAVRWLVEHDPRVVHTDERGPTTGPHMVGADDPEPRWSTSWGEPVNQEDLIGTLLTFTEVVFEVFDETGVTYSREEADDYLHAWSVVAWILGVRPDLLPLDRTVSTPLLASIRRRQYAPSLAGREMTAALLEVAEVMLPTHFKGIPPTTLRHFVGDHVGDLLGVPKSDWSRHLFGPMAELTKILGTGKRDVPAIRTISEHVGRAFLDAMVAAERGGGRAGFDIPTHLAEKWSVGEGTGG